MFSFAKGIIHPYYTVALAPAIGAVVGIGVTMLWQRRGDAAARLTLAAACAATAVWAYVLLDRTPSYHPELRVSVLALGLTAAVLLALIDRFAVRRATAIALAAVVVGLAAPAAFSLTTVSTASAGAIPSAGPTVAGSGFGGGAPSGRGAPGGAQPGGMPQGGGFGQPPAGMQAGGGPPTGGMRGRAGGLLNGSTPSAALVTALKANSAIYTWVAATVGSNSASGYQLATGDPVMAIGGFNGTDPAPTLAQFIEYVREGKIHYFIAGGGMGGGGMTGNSKISAWVKAHYTAQTIGGTTIYDLTNA